VTCCTLCRQERLSRPRPRSPNRKSTQHPPFLGSSPRCCAMRTDPAHVAEPHMASRAPQQSERPNWSLRGHALAASAPKAVLNHVGLPRAPARVHHGRRAHQRAVWHPWTRDTAAQRARRRDASRRARQQRAAAGWRTRGHRQAPRQTPGMEVKYPVQYRILPPRVRVLHLLARGAGGRSSHKNLTLDRDEIKWRATDHLHADGSARGIGQ